LTLTGPFHFDCYCPFCVADLWELYDRVLGTDTALERVWCPICKQTVEPFFMTPLQFFQNKMHERENEHTLQDVVLRMVDDLDCHIANMRNEEDMEQHVEEINRNEDNEWKVKRYLSTKK